MSLKHLGLLLLLGAVWSTSFLFIKLTVGAIPTESLVAGRLLIAAAILVVALYATGGKLPGGWRMWGNFLFAGVVGLVLPFLLITEGEQSISSGMTAILNATTPLFTVLLAYVATREERLGGLKLAGLLLGFVGVVVAVSGDDLRLSSSGFQGQLMVLVAALCYGISGLYARRAFRGVPALVSATGQMLMGALVVTPLALLRNGLPTALPSPTALGALLALAVLGTAGAYILFYWLLERLGATRTSMVTYLLPPLALLYGALFLREVVTGYTIAGLLLVLLGIMLANGLIAFPQKKAAQATSV
ncbi:MAG: DMT family transporter [Roseiflexaceae bacterium]